MACAIAELKSIFATSCCKNVGVSRLRATR
jgi:hypothetical protein